MTRLISSELFTRLPHDNIQRFFASLEAVEAGAGEVIVEQGTPGDYLYIVAEGTCEVTRRAPGSGQELQLAVLKAGDTFGEESLISSSPRNASVKMLSAGFVMRLPKAGFAELVGNPTLRALPYSEACQQVAEGSVWLDVRFPDEHEANAIDGSLNVPLNALRVEAAKLDQDKQYVVYCDTGARSSTGAFLLARAGFEACYLAGGLDRTPLSTEAPIAADDDEEEEELAAAADDDFEFVLVNAVEPPPGDPDAAPVSPAESREPPAAVPQPVETARQPGSQESPPTKPPSAPQPTANIAAYQARLVKVTGERDKAAVYGQQAVEAARAWKKRCQEQADTAQAEQAKREALERELATLRADAEREAKMEQARLVSELASVQRRAEELDLERRAGKEALDKERERAEARIKAAENDAKLATGAKEEQESLRIAAEVAFDDTLQSVREQLAAEQEKATKAEAERDRLRVQLTEAQDRVDQAEGSMESQDSEQQQLLDDANADLKREREQLNDDRASLEEALAKFAKRREQLEITMARDQGKLELEAQSMRERSAALDTREMDLADHRGTVEADVLRREQALDAAGEALRKEKESWQAQVESAIAEERGRLEKEVEKAAQDARGTAQVAATESAEQQVAEMRADFEAQAVELKARYEGQLASAKATVQKLRTDFNTRLAEQEALLEDERRGLETETVRLREALIESRRAMKELEEMVARDHAGMADETLPDDAEEEQELVLEIGEPDAASTTEPPMEEVPASGRSAPVAASTEPSLDLEIDEAALAESDPEPVYQEPTADALPEIETKEDLGRTTLVDTEKSVRVISADQMEDIRARMQEKMNASKAKSS